VSRAGPSSQALTSAAHLFGASGFVGVNSFAAGAIAVGVISGAYQGEIFRGAFHAIARGELEAARSVGMPRLLLSHNPDVAEDAKFLTSGHRVDLMLSGHTHGGQVRLPVIGTPVTNSKYGQKYAQGLIEGPACAVYVSRGLGMTAMPIRLGVRAEIALIELRSATPS